MAVDAISFHTMFLVILLLYEYMFSILHRFGRSYTHFFVVVVVVVVDSGGSDGISDVL